MKVLDLNRYTSTPALVALCAHGRNPGLEEIRATLNHLLTGPGEAECPEFDCLNDEFAQCDALLVNDRLFQYVAGQDREGDAFNWEVAELAQVVSLGPDLSPVDLDILCRVAERLSQNESIGLIMQTDAAFENLSNRTFAVLDRFRLAGLEFATLMERARLAAVAQGRPFPLPWGQPAPAEELAESYSAEFEGETYSFDTDEMAEFVYAEHLTPAIAQELAELFAANLELPREFNEDGTVSLERSNFNDSFGDMQEDLIMRSKRENW